MLAFWHGHSSDAGESLGGATVNTIPNANLLAKTFLIVSSTSLARKSSYCARLLLLAHNPCIAIGRHKDVIWKVSSVVTISIVLFKDISLYIHLFIDDMIGIQAC
jgi:hypothetical protein